MARGEKINLMQNGYAVGLQCIFRQHNLQLQCLAPCTGARTGGPGIDRTGDKEVANIVFYRRIEDAMKQVAVTGAERLV